jgi:choline kinase
MQTIILAAGAGARLAGARGDVPKPLLTIGGAPLIAHALEHARASGCREAVVVIGYDGRRVKSAVEAMRPGLAVRFVENPDAGSPNGESLLAAESLASSRFFLQMVDHVFCDVALPRLVSAPFESMDGGRVLVDRSPTHVDVDDATKVRLEGDRVRAIGKGLASWDAIDAGCFVLTPAIFEALRQVPRREPRTVSSGMRQLAADGLLGAVDIQGLGWVDVDTPADREAAERMLPVAQT